MQFVNEEREHTVDVADMGPSCYRTTRWNQTCAILEHDEIEQYTSKATDLALIGRQFEKTIQSIIDAYKDQIKQQARLDHSRVSKNVFYNQTVDDYINLCCNEFKEHIEKQLTCFGMNNVYEELADELNIPYHVPEVRRKMKLEDVDYLDRRFNNLTNVYSRLEKLFDPIHQTFTPTKPINIKKQNIILNSVWVFVFGLIGAVMLDAIQII